MPTAELAGPELDIRLVMSTIASGSFGCGWRSRTAAFQGDLLRAGVGPPAIRKSMTLLGAVLQRAAEGRRIPYNRSRVVRKARLPLAPEVRPLAPSRVEAMRAAAGLRDATIISVLAYAGLRPGELRELRWRQVRERTF